MTTTETLERIAAIGTFQAERATTLPPEAYWSPEIYELEVERIFRREWMCVARSEQLAEPGSWLSVDLVGEPLVLTRADDGTLHALSRVCRHRSMDLLNEEAGTCGVAKRLTCPYHQWNYRLDGSLAAAPEMGRADGFDKDEVSLPSFPVAEWQGFVFVNLDPTATGLDARFDRIAEAIAPYDLSDWRLVGTDDWGTQPVNWKVVIENGCETYHHIGTHRNTLQALWPGQSIIPDGGHDDGYLAVPMVVSDAMAVGRSDDGRPISPTFLPVPDIATSLQLSATWVLGVFPMFFVALSADFATWFRWLPTGPESHAIDIHTLVPSTTDDDAVKAALPAITEAVHTIQSEDARTNIGVMRGLKSSAAPAAGRLSHLERPLWQFHRYLADRLS